MSGDVGKETAELRAHKDLLLIGQAVSDYFNLPAHASLEDRERMIVYVDTLCRMLRSGLIRTITGYQGVLSTDRKPVGKELEVVRTIQKSRTS